MVPDRDDPPENPPVGSASEHLRTAFGHVISAISIVYISLRKIVTTRPPLDRIWHGVFGTQRKSSVMAVVCAPVAAVVTGLLVNATYGYSRIEQLVIGETHSLGQWVSGRWVDAGPHIIALVGIFLLITLAAAYSAKNSGLVPTTLVVMGPIFGIGLARYGMMIEHFSPSKLHRLFGATAMHFETVGVAEALGTALFIALLWGIPIGLFGFTLGTIGRKINGSFGRRRSGNPTSDI